MTYEQIETFLAIVTHGTVSAAAKVLHISQSTASSRIQQLEDELAAPLIVRTKGRRTTELTPYGQAFIPIASQWASLWNDTQCLRTTANTQLLTITSVDAVNNYTFVPLFKKHIMRFPDIKLSINTFHSKEIYAQIESRQADIGFVFQPISYNDVISRPIYRELMYLVFSKGADYHDGMACAALDSTKEIYLNWGPDFKQWHDAHFSPAINPLITVNTGSMLQRYLDVPGSWAVAPMSVINGAMRANPHLTYVTLETPPSPRICYEIKNRYPVLSRAQALEDFEAEVEEYIAGDETICSFEAWMLK